MIWRNGTVDQVGDLLGQKQLVVSRVRETRWTYRVWSGVDWRCHGGRLVK